MPPGNKRVNPDKGDVEPINATKHAGSVKLMCAPPALSLSFAEPLHASRGSLRSHIRIHKKKRAALPAPLMSGCATPLFGGVGAGLPAAVCARISPCWKGS